MDIDVVSLSIGGLYKSPSFTKPMLGLLDHRLGRENDAVGTSAEDVTAATPLWPASKLGIIILNYTDKLK